MHTAPADISVIICAYTLDRESDLVAAVASVDGQTLAPVQRVLVIDHNAELLQRAQAAFSEWTVVENAVAPGLSGARNTGLALTTGEVVAFIDDDAVASPTWLEELASAYTDDNVLGVGGFIAPLWESARPGWFPEEFDWVIGCTYRGMPAGSEVRNLIGANMSFHRSVLMAAGGFSRELGRTKTQALGDEETGACIRASQLYPDGRFIYAPSARVDHRVPASRTGWRYFRERCYGEGVSKAHLSRAVGSRDGLASERRHALLIIPAGVSRALTASIHGDRAGAARAGALVAGLWFTASAYLGTRLKLAAMMPSRDAATAASPASPLAAQGESPGAPAAARMKLLFVTPRYFPLVGGVEHHVAQVARLLASDVDVTVLTTDRSGELEQDCTVDGVRILRVPAWPRDRDYYVAPRVYRTIVDGPWDLVHVQSYHTAVAPLAMSAALRARVPFVLTFHGGGHSSKTREGLRRYQWAVLRPLLARAERLIAVARFEAERFSAILELPRERFSVIPNGSDLPAVAPEELAQLASEGESTIVSVGRLERYKGHDRIIAAMPAVVAAIPEAQLRILGTGPYQAELESLVERLGMGEHVTIGSIPPEDRTAMAHALARSALTVLMSDFETHPIAVIEALALGRPALVADTSGLRELAERGLARAIPLDSTPTQLAEAIVKELRHPRTVPEMSAPTWRECADSLLALYHEVLDSEAGGAMARGSSRAERE